MLDPTFHNVRFYLLELFKHLKLMLDPKYIYSIQISILNNFFSCLLKMSLFTLVFKMDGGSILKGMGNENQPRF